MKTKKSNLITLLVLLLTLAIALTAVFFVREDTGKSQPPKKENESVTDVSSKIESEEINIEKVESEIVSSEEKFIEPDETKADELLKEHSSKKEETVSSKPKEDKTTVSKTDSVVCQTSSKPTETKTQKQESKPMVSTSSKKETVKTESKKENTETQTFDEGKKELENTANDYLKKHNIDPKTAGETGELCPNCNKKIWNPDKYGFFIPGMPDDYENSGYCLGTCGITLE